MTTPTTTPTPSTGSWRGVAAEDQDELSDKVSGLLRVRSRRLLGDLLTPHRKAIALLTAVIVVSNAAGLAIPYLVKVGIDEGIPPMLRGTGPGTLLTVVGVILAAAVTQALTRQAFLTMSGRIGQDILLELRRRVFDHFQRLSLSFHEKYTSGRVISRLTSDIEAIAELLHSGFDGLVTAVLTMFGTAALLLVLDFHLGLVALIPLPLLLLFTRWFRRQSAIVYRRTRETVALVIVHFVESMTGIRAVQAFRREPRNQEIFKELNDDYRDANVRAMKLIAIFMPGIKLIGNVTVAGVLFYGGWLAFHGEVTVGVLTAFLLYLRGFYEPMQEISQFYNTLQSASAALEKLSGVLEEEPVVPEPREPTPLPAPRGTVRFEGVRFAYVEEMPILPGLDLTIPAGQSVALVGSTGAGKTTLAKLITRFYDPTAGRVLLDGVDLRSLDETTLRARRGHGDAGELPVQRHGHGQHHVRQAGRHRTGGAGGGQGDRRARVHLGAARRLPDRGGQARRPDVGGAAPARRLRQGVPGRPRGADPGRGHLQPGRAQRAAGPARAAHDPVGPYGADHRAPAVHRGDRRPGAGHGAGRDRRGRAARRSDHRLGPLRRPAPGLAGQSQLSQWGKATAAITR